VAYARVLSNGDVAESYSRGVTDADVFPAGNGRYCFAGLGFAFRTAQATIDYADSSAGGTTQVARGNPKGECPAGNQLEVFTTSGPAGFYVWFFD
jgi:hypothetical protein